MDRRTPRTSRWLRVCSVALIGGSLLPTGCTRSPREVFSQAWDPVKKWAAGLRPGCESQDGCGTVCSPQLALDPSQDPFLIGMLAPSEFPPAERKTADASAAVHPTDPAEAQPAHDPQETAPAALDASEGFAQQLLTEDEDQSPNPAEPTAEVSPKTTGAGAPTIAESDRVNLAKLARIEAARLTGPKADHPADEPTPAATALRNPVVESSAFDEPAVAGVTPPSPAVPQPAPETNPAAGDDLIVESDQLPSRFEQEAPPRAVLRPNNGTAYAAVITTPDAAKPGGTADPESLVYVSANAGGVVELEGPGETPHVIPGVAVQRTYPEALPPRGTVPEPQDVPAAAPPMAPVLVTSVPTLVPRVVIPPAPSAAVEDPAAPPPAHAVPNVHWNDQPQVEPQSAELPPWWPVAAGGSVAALGALLLWRKRSAT